MGGPAHPLSLAWGGVAGISLTFQTPATVGAGRLVMFHVKHGAVGRGQRFVVHRR
jgi:hypothetical protein